MTPNAQGCGTGQAKKMNVQQKKSQAIEAVKDRAVRDALEFFHDAFHRAFATVPVERHRETWEITSKRFRLWVLRTLYDILGCAPPKQWVANCIEEFQAHALCRGPMLEVSLRAGNIGDTTYIDLADADWRAIEVSGDGWRIIPEAPVKFRRAVGMASLPLPESGGNLRQLSHFLNIRPQSQILLLAWLSFALSKGPFPVLVLEGVQGCGKSSMTKLLRSLIDPSVAMLTAAPKSERDLAIAATNSLLIALDNLSSISNDLSDALCRVATGGAFRCRTLYTNSDENIFTFRSPAIVNGVETLVTRPDLLDRSLLIHLEPIPKEKRRDERELLREFEEERPRLIGALLNTVSAGLRNLPSVSLPHLPRMADFARWGCAVEEHLGFASGEFLAAYRQNLDDANAAALEASPVARAVHQYLIGLPDGHFNGSAKRLLEEITVFVESTKHPGISSQALERKHPSWPKSPNKLSGEIRRIQPNLQKLGISCEFGRTNTQRWIDLKLAIQTVRDDSEERGNPTVTAEPVRETDDVAA